MRCAVDVEKLIKSLVIFSILLVCHSNSQDDQQQHSHRHKHDSNRKGMYYNNRLDNE